MRCFLIAIIYFFSFSFMDSFAFQGGVRRAIQLRDAIFVNNTNMVLTLVDEVADANGTHNQTTFINPQQQKTLSWNRDIQSAFWRKVTIVGSPLNSGSAKTNVIALGNTSDATNSPAGQEVGGTYTISVLNGNAIVLTQGGGLGNVNTDPIKFPRGIRVWDVIVFNETGLEGLAVTDEVFMSDGKKYTQQAVLSKSPPNNQFRFHWVNLPPLIQARKITIQGACQGATGKTNRIIIGNVDACSDFDIKDRSHCLAVQPGEGGTTYFLPVNGAPSGSYRIGRPDPKKPCHIAIIQNAKNRQ